MNATVRPTNNFDVTKFDELNFNPHPSGMGGVQAVVQFPNGYGASVVKTPFTYGGERGLYELAVFGKDGNITYDTSITNDVLGHLSEEEVEQTLLNIKNL